MNCTKSECIQEWKEYVKDDAENEASYEKGNYKFVHCDEEGCHTLYWKGKNGETCAKCRREICEGHACDKGYFDEDWDLFYCSRCVSTKNKQ